MLAMVADTAFADTYSYEFTAAVYSGAGTRVLNGVSWRMETDAGYFGYEAQKGQQIGSAKKSATTLTLSTGNFQGRISGIKVTTCGASSISGTISATVGGAAYGSAYELSSSPETFTFSGTGEGEIVLKYVQTSKKAIYIKAIEVTYNGSIAPAEIVTVESISAFNALDDDTEATLYLSDEQGARVLFSSGTNAYIRDNTGALCFYGFAKTPTMAYNQHVAGYITGKKATVGSLPAMKATSRTNTDLLAIAEPVTEENVTPLVITAAEFGDHYGDWVTIRNIEMTDSVTGYDGTAPVTIVNSFRISQYTAPAVGEKADISGIVNSTATADGRLSPIYVTAAATREGNPTLNYSATYPAIVLATGIENIYNKVGSTDDHIYNLTGCRVDKVSNLPKGIYIVKGKKVIIK